MNECIICYYDITHCKSIQSVSPSKIKVRSNVFCLSSNQAANQNAPGCILPCGHSFHKKCLYTWLKKKRNCPICRAPVEIQYKKPIKGKGVGESWFTSVRGSLIFSCFSPRS